MGISPGDIPKPAYWHDMTWLALCGQPCTQGSSVNINRAPTITLAGAAAVEVPVVRPAGYCPPRHPPHVRPRLFNLVQSS
jgi:hypothetical protein